jgi:hypothetical protein
MSSSVRDLLITSWLIVFAVTLGVALFHPSFQSDGLEETIRLAVLSLISTLAGVGLIRYTEILGRSSSRFRKIALVIFVICMIPLVPVALVTFAMPWAALIILSLIYVRWKWALITSIDQR